jgi:hypothetical protein
MTSPDTLYTKNVDNELSFLLVTHTTCFDIQFGRYGFSIQVSVLDRFWTDWVYRCLTRFLGQKMSETCWGLNTSSEGNNQLSDAYSNTFFIIATMVTTI